MTLTCWRGLYIRGTVVDPAGEPVDGAFVTAAGQGIFVYDNAAGGSFSTGPLAPGSYAVRASNFGGGFADAEAVNVRTGAEDLFLELRRGARVSVTVLDSRAVPASNVMVWALAERAEDSMGTFTNAEGKAQFDGRLPGPYTFSASTPAGEFAMARVVVLVPERDIVDVDLRLEPAARLRIRVVPSTEKGMGAVILVDGRPIEYGLLDENPVVVVPAGEVEVELIRWRESELEVLQRRTARAILGEETLVEFDLGASRK